MATDKTDIGAAGQSLREKIAAIDGEEISAAIWRALGATSNTPAGSYPDYRVQLDAAKLAIAYLVGRPHEAPPMPQAPADDDSANDYEEKLAASPAMQAALQRMLDRAAKKGGIKKVPAGPPAP